MPNDSDLLEQLADAEHASWARRMDDLFRLCDRNPDGSVTIPAALVTHWERKARMPYAELSEWQKDCDRDEVRKILPLIEARTARLEALAADREERYVELLKQRSPGPPLPPYEPPTVADLARSEKGGGGETVERKYRRKTK